MQPTGRNSDVSEGRRSKGARTSGSDGVAKHVAQLVERREVVPVIGYREGFTQAPGLRFANGVNERAIGGKHECCWMVGQLTGLMRNSVGMPDVVVITEHCDGVIGAGANPLPEVVSDASRRVSGS